MQDSIKNYEMLAKVEVVSSVSVRKL